MSGVFLKQFFMGFAAPLYSARFLFKKKSLFLLGIMPHILNFILYFWIVRKVIIDKWLEPFLNSLLSKKQDEFIFIILKSNLLEVFIWIFAIILYGVLGTSFVNAAASPIYDYIAQKSYEGTSTLKIPLQGIADYIDSILSEVTKAVFVFCFFIISLFIQVFAPFIFLLSIWYLGWNSLDRTLLLLNLPLKERVRFGFENAGLCIGLGLWCYLPIISSLFAFTTASAGAILVAKTKVPYFDEDKSPGADF